MRKPRHACAAQWKASGIAFVKDFKSMVCFFQNIHILIIILQEARQ